MHGSYFMQIIRASARKPEFDVSDQVMLNQAFSATENSLYLGILHALNLAIVLFREQITKVLIRLHRW